MHLRDISIAHTHVRAARGRNPPGIRAATHPRLIAAVYMFVAIAVPGGATAQEPTDSLRAEMARLAALVDSLSQEVARLREAGQEPQADDALARLRAAAVAAAGGQATTAEGAEDQEFVGRQRSLQALNPEISVNADIFGHLNKDDVSENNFFAREFEVSIISNLDPFSRAKVFLSHHGAGAEIAPFEDSEDAHTHEEEVGGGLAVEEGYVEWVGLPGGVGLKLGKFFQQFGQLNRWHGHALPFQTRSFPHLAFIGEESLAQSGVSVHWLAPFGGLGGTYEATVEATRSGNETLFGEAGDLSLLGHLNGFWNLSPSTDFDLGLSWIRGTYMDDHNAGDRDLYGAEMAFTWRPPARSRYRGFTLRGGVMALNGLISEEEHESENVEPESEDIVSALLDKRALGWWSAGELRLSQSWLVGARFGRVQHPEDTSETAWVMSPTLTWWQSEYVRLRLEYDLLGRSFSSNNEGRLFIQVTMAMGPHKHETY